MLENEKKMLFFGGFPVAGMKKKKKKKEKGCRNETGWATTPFPSLSHDTIFVS